MFYLKKKLKKKGNMLDIQCWSQDFGPVKIFWYVRFLAGKTELDN